MHKISNDFRIEFNVNRIPDHANRHKSITKQDVSSTARVRRKKKRKKNAMRFLLSHRVCARAIFFYTVSLVNRWICSCQVNLYCHKSMCSVLVIVPWSLTPCSFAPICPSSLKSCLSVCVRSRTCCHMRNDDKTIRCSV